MGRFILILAIAFVAFAARGQTATFGIVPQNNMFSVTTDYTITNTTAVWFQFNAARAIPSTHDFQVELDSLTGDHTNIDVSLYGRKFSGSAWVQIGATQSSGSAATHSVVSNINNTAANRFRSYKVLFTPTGTGTTTIDFMKLKLWNE